MAEGTKTSTGFKVINIDELTRIGDDNRPEHYYRHTIRTRGGTVLRVDVDAADFTPERVREILTERSTNADKIKAL